MTKQEYEAKRKELTAQARQFLDGGKPLDAKKIMDEVEKLDGEFAKAALDAANAMALSGVQTPVKMENLTVSVKGKVTETMNQEEKLMFDNKSPEYRAAFYNALRGAELTQEQRSAFEAVNGVTMQNAKTTTTEAAVVPAQTLNEIWDLCKEQHSILGDIDMRITGVVIEVSKRTAITKGKGKVVSENTANDSMEDTKVKVTLSGKDFSATVELSYAAAKMSIDALEDFIVKDVAEQVGNAMAADAIASIKSGMAVANKMTSAATTGFTYEEICTLFGLLKRCQSMTAYVSNSTLYNRLVSLVDGNGRPIFQQNMQEGAKGALLGATIKLEDSVADDAILVGDPKRVICNVVQDILLETDRDIKTHTVIHSAYARAQTELIDDKSFSLLTLKTA